jgi:hypothetical protein
MDRASGDPIVLGRKIVAMSLGLDQLNRISKPIPHLQPGVSPSRRFRQSRASKREATDYESTFLQITFLVQLHSRSNKRGCYMTQDSFAAVSDSVIAPASEAFAIIPKDNGELTRATKALYVGTGGDIVLRAVGSQEDVTLRNVVAGSVIAIRVRAIRATGTTAANLVGFA